MSSNDQEVEIDGVLYSYRCDICWQELDETDIQFKPCNRCHLQVCLFCFNKHTNRKESYSKTCPKCREPIDMEQIMKQNMNQSKSRHTLAKKLLSKKITNNTSPNTANSHKKRKRKKSANKDSSAYNDHGHSHSVDIDEEVPKTDWKNYLKGRFISRDSIIVAPVIAKFNNEEAISDNFKAYGRITRINMWDDESAHIMYDKQYFADALVDKIQDVAVRYQGQFGLMSAKYHFRRPCEEFMDPDRRCPMQCRKFHGPYYKLDFIPLEQYLDEEAREQWIQERKKHVSGIVRARYKKFRKKFMDGIPLPIAEKNKEEHNGKHKGYNEEECEEDTNYGYNDYYAGYNARYRYTPRYQNNNNNKPQQTPSQSVNTKHAITLKYNNMGKANKLLALDDSLRQHMRLKPNQPLPPSRPPPLPPNGIMNHTGDDGGQSVCTDSTQSNSTTSIGSGRRTRPPIHHTTSAQIGQFMATDPNLNINVQFNNEDHSKSNKVAALMGMGMGMNKIQRAKSETEIDIMNNYYVKGAHSASSGCLQSKQHSVNSHLVDDRCSHSTSNLRTLKTVDLLKSLKKKKRKQRAMTNVVNNNVAPFTAYNNSHNPYGLVPFKPPQVRSIAKKSKLNANAASYKPLNKLGHSSTNRNRNTNDRNHHNNSNIKSFDIRNLGPLLGSNGILKKGNGIKDYVYDFGAALDEIHHEEKKEKEKEQKKKEEKEKKEKKKEKTNVKENVSSDDSSDDEYGFKWTEHLLWDKVCAIVKKEREKEKPNQNWQNIRKLLKCSMSFMDWNYVKEMNYIKKVKAKFRIEFEHINGDENENENGNISDLLIQENIRTKEALSFGNLLYDECNVIDLDLRISDIRNYMTDLLTRHPSCQPSQYDTAIIAELGQILSVYQKWIDNKKLRKEELSSDHLFGIPIQNEDITYNHPINNSNDHESDFYSRLLDQVQQQSKEFDDDEHEHDNPKDLVMDYIGIKNDHNILKKDDNDDDNKEQEIEYDYEYSDIDDDDDDNKNDDALYQYDDDEVNDDDNDKNGIFSRCHSPPPRHRNNKDDEEKDRINGNDNKDDDQVNDIINGDRHYYNARYPPRRGRYHYQRYIGKNNQNILNNSVKMEWKKKEKEEKENNENDENKTLQKLNENEEK